jgi:hypothetical protein
MIAAAGIAGLCLVWLAGVLPDMSPPARRAVRYGGAAVAGVAIWAVWF